MEDTNIIIDWVNNETNNNVIVKKKSKFWLILNYFFTFLFGLFVGLITTIFIMDY